MPKIHMKSTFRKFLTLYVTNVILVVADPACRYPTLPSRADEILTASALFENHINRDETAPLYGRALLCI